MKKSKPQTQDTRNYEKKEEDLKSNQIELTEMKLSEQVKHIRSDVADR